MTAQDPLIIDRPVNAGEKFEHTGSIIFKTYVPDNVEAKATQGGIMLEQGGGNGLKLGAKGGSGMSGSASISVSGGSVVIRGGFSGSVSVVNDRVFIGGKEVSPNDFNNNAKPQLSGVTSKARLGDNVTIATDASVRIEDAGNDSNIRAGGSLNAGNIGDHCFLDISGSVSTGNVGMNAKVDAGGSLNAGTLGANGNFDVGGSANFGTAESNTVVDTGGSINGGYAKSGVKLDAGGSINLGGADQDIETDAGGSIRIAGQKQSGQKPGFDFKF